MCHCSLFRYLPIDTVNAHRHTTAATGKAIIIIANVGIARGANGGVEKIKSSCTLYTELIESLTMITYMQ